VSAHKINVFNKVVVVLTQQGEDKDLPCNDVTYPLVRSFDNYNQCKCPLVSFF